MSVDITKLPILEGVILFLLIALAVAFAGAFIATSDGRNKLGITALVCLALAEHPDRDTPYGVIEVPGALSGWDFASGVAVGGLSTLALVGLVAILRRRRTAATSRDSAKVSTLPNTPWVEASAALARAPTRMVTATGVTTRRSSRS